MRREYFDNIWTSPPVEWYMTLTPRIYGTVCTEMRLQDTALKDAEENENFLVYTCVCLVYICVCFVYICVCLVYISAELETDGISTANGCEDEFLKFVN